MVGGYTEDLAKLQNCPNFRVGACNEVRYFLPSDVWKKECSKDAQQTADQRLAQL